MEPQTTEHMIRQCFQCYASGMPKAKRSPQEKKHLELQKDHFTFSEFPHAFRKTWKRKKVQANREKRRKSEELLSQAKPGISWEDTELIAGDLTPERLRNVTRKRLKKSGTVSVGEKIKFKKEKREATVGRRVAKTSRYVTLCTEAIQTLNSLADEVLLSFVPRLQKLMQGGDPSEWMRLQYSIRPKSQVDPIDRALHFLERIQRGDANFVDVLRKDKKLHESFQLWQQKQDRMIAKVERTARHKLEQQKASERKTKTILRRNRGVD